MISGCTSSTDQESELFESESGMLTVWFANDEFHRGDNRVEMCVVDQDDTAVDGLDISMFPFMPAMGHGSSASSTSEALGSGCYAFKDIVLSMPGVWELRSTIEGSTSDSVVAKVYVH